MLSHSETDLEQPSISQRTGSHRAPLTSGLSRMSRLKRKIIKASVRQDAMLGGRCIGYIRGRRTEDRGQRAGTEGGGRRAEDRRQTTEDGVGVQRCSANWTTFTRLLSGS